MGGGPFLWWCYDERRWVGCDERITDGSRRYSSHAPCRTYKAFKRHLRKHSEMLAGREVVLLSRYLDHDIIALPRTRIWVS